MINAFWFFPSLHNSEIILRKSFGIRFHLISISSCRICSAPSRSAGDKTVVCSSAFLWSFLGSKHCNRNMGWCWTCFPLPPWKWLGPAQSGVGCGCRKESRQRLASHLFSSASSSVSRCPPLQLESETLSISSRQPGRQAGFREVCLKVNLSTHEQQYPGSCLDFLSLPPRI